MADPQTPTEYLDEAGLKEYDKKRKAQTEEIYVKKEYKTGSSTDYKGLSDNNLTDELLEKINNAGDSSFTGDYDDLTDKPAIDGHELSRSTTAEELGLVTDESMEEYVDGKLASTYKPAGSVETIEQLPALTKANLGNVYNVKASFVTTNAFVEGVGKDYPAGTNVAIVETDSDIYKYDALSGFVDLSDYVTKTSIQPIPNSKIDALFE